MSHAAQSRRKTQAKATPTTPLVYQLHVALAGIEPPIWRQMLVPGHITLFGLHEFLQVVMGWQNEHLHLFVINGTTYSEPDPEEEYVAKDDRRVRLQQVVPQAGETFRYEYDFGDSWRHDITVEGIMPENTWTSVPACLDGQRACPPEDCGGVSGYANLVEALGHRRHPDHRQLREWVGPRYDPEVFSLQAVNAALSVLAGYVLR